MKVKLTMCYTESKLFPRCSCLTIIVQIFCWSPNVMLSLVRYIPDSYHLGMNIKVFEFICKNLI
jgi:hypothetical protein